MAEQFISLARQLPTRLQTFFAKYPPGTCNTARTNPFKPTVHTVTGKWHNPVFSYRRQAELCKMARKWGVEELLPHSKKRSDIREEQRLKRVAKGIHVKGTKEERTLKARYVESLWRSRWWKVGKLGRWCLRRRANAVYAACISGACESRGSRGFREAWIQARDSRSRYARKCGHGFPRLSPASMPFS